MEKYVNELFNFINESPTIFHNVKLVKTILNNFSFIELKENTKWYLEAGKSYYVIREDASIITFKTPLNAPNGFNIVASHNDSPCFKIKPEGLIISDNYNKLNVEGYGGMILSTWLDRPLSVAGRVYVKTKEGLESRLVNLSGHTIVIPNVAIHLTREATQDTLNKQVDMLPITGVNLDKATLLEKLNNVCIFEDGEEIVSYDLYLYNKEEGCVAGFGNDLILSPKLDDLECAFSSLEAFLEATPNEKINVCCIFDNEEVGSGSNHAAGSTFLTDVLERICASFDLDKYMMYAGSMLVSADNAHAVHPAHLEKSDPTNRVFMNKGIVIKHQAGLSYTTTALSNSIFKTICDKAGVPTQNYTNRSDMRGGSTLGHIQLEKLSITSVDIGLAQLAMHSSFETAGAKDIAFMVKGLKEFYSSNIKINDNKITL